MCAPRVIWTRTPTSSNPFAFLRLWSKSGGSWAGRKITGGALRIEFEHETLPAAGWAGPRKWKQISPHCSEFVRGQLEPVVAQIRACQKQLARVHSWSDVLLD